MVTKQDNQKEKERTKRQRQLSAEIARLDKQRKAAEADAGSPLRGGGEPAAALFSEVSLGSSSPCSRLAGAAGEGE